jgi:hypothetical protein
MLPATKPPMASLYVSFFALKFADARRKNSYVPPMAAVTFVSMLLRLASQTHVPKTAMVPPYRVNVPSSPMFCFWRVA